MALAKTVRLFLCGDVMTGRGIDQILPHPAPPRLYEPHVTSAVDYVRLAEKLHGDIPRAADWNYVWGAALEAFERMAPDVRIANLETAVTLSEDAAAKGINYRMNPANVPVLTAAGLDVCTLANNHVLDWGRRGLEETLESLETAGIVTCGAGLDARHAARPAIVEVAGGRVLVFGFAHGSSGVPRHWSANESRPGVSRLADLSATTARRIGESIAMWRRDGDVVAVSIHWGGNWGYDVPEEQSDFARRLIGDAGVSVVHGHSSHHAKALERYRDGLIVYGAGDFLNDYEGIGGHDGYRDDLVLMIWPDICVDSGAVTDCTMTPLRLRNMHLVHPADSERQWLAALLDRESRDFATAVRLTAKGDLRVERAG